MNLRDIIGTVIDKYSMVCIKETINEYNTYQWTGLAFRIKEEYLDREFKPIVVSYGMLIIELK